MKRTNTLIRKKFIEFFIPTVLTTMAGSIAMLVDSTIVNLTLGASAFAAVNLMTPILQVYVAISILFGLSSATIIAKIKGENKSGSEKSNLVFTSIYHTRAYQRHNDYPAASPDGRHHFTAYTGR